MIARPKGQMNYGFDGAARVQSTLVFGANMLAKGSSFGIADAIGFASVTLQIAISPVLVLSRQAIGAPSPPALTAI